MHPLAISEVPALTKIGSTKPNCRRHTVSKVPLVLAVPESPGWLKDRSARPRRREPGKTLTRARQPAAVGAVLTSAGRWCVIFRSLLARTAAYDLLAGGQAGVRNGRRAAGRHTPT